MIGLAAKLVLGSAFLAVPLGAASVADAKPIKHHHAYYAAAPVVYARPPLTVNKRSFLDPGPVVPVGSESAYMVQNTYFVQTPDQGYQGSRFGNYQLPRPLEVPGRPAPIYEFETPRYLPY